MTRPRDSQPTIHFPILGIFLKVTDTKAAPQKVKKATIIGGKGNDTLEVYFSDEKINRSESFNDVELFFGEKGVVKANIYGIKKYVKIRINGVIYYPSDEFIALVNGYLGAHDLMLSGKYSSGFEISKKDEKFVVIAKKDTFLPSIEFVKEDKICSFMDLSISDSNCELVIEEGLKDEDIGKDFFDMEAHENVGN